MSAMHGIGEMLFIVGGVMVFCAVPFVLAGMVLMEAARAAGR